MIENLQREELLVRQGTALPDSLKVFAPDVQGQWCLLRGMRSADLGRRLDPAGWQFFFVPPEVRANAFGVSQKHALARALKKILVNAACRAQRTGSHRDIPVFTSHASRRDCATSSKAWS